MRLIGRAGSAIVLQENHRNLCRARRGNQSFDGLEQSGMVRDRFDPGDECHLDIDNDQASAVASTLSDCSTKKYLVRFYHIAKIGKSYGDQDRFVARTWSHSVGLLS